MNYRIENKLKFVFKFIIGINIALSGCVQSEQLSCIEPSDLPKFSYQRTMGYYNNSIDSMNRPLLWDLLVPKSFLQKDKHKIPANARIKVEFDEENKLLVSAFEKDTLLAQVRIKGKVKGNYYSIKKKFVLIPIPMAFYVHDEYKSIVTNDSDGDLIVKHGKFSILWILMMVGDEKTKMNSYTFKKIKN